MDNKQPPVSAEPFWAESKTSWIFYRYTTSETGQEIRHLIKRRNKEKLKEGHARLVEQTELTVNSAPYEFPLIAKFRFAEELAPKPG